MEAVGNIWNNCPLISLTSAYAMEHESYVQYSTTAYPTCNAQLGIWLQHAIVRKPSRGWYSAVLQPAT
jgi:hypothetical protein